MERARGEQESKGMVGKQDQESNGGNHDIGRVATLDEVSRRAVRGSRVAT